MKTGKRTIVAFIISILTISVFSPSSIAIYDNSQVYTIVGGARYHMQDTLLMQDNRVLVDFQSLTYKDSQTVISAEMMKTLLITDLAGDVQKGHPYIYAVGMVFKNDQDNPNDSSSYKYQKLRLGTPYIVIISYNVDHVKDYPCYQENNLLMEATLRLPDNWESAFNTEVKDDPDQSPTWNTLYNYASRIAHPRIIMSKEYDHKAYILTQDGPGPGKDAIFDPHIKVFTFNTDRSIGPYKKFQPEFYMCYWWIEQEGKKYGDYNLRLDRFSMKETKKDHIVVYNFGDKLSVAFEMDISVHTQPKWINTYWQDTKKLGIDNN